MTETSLFSTHDNDEQLVISYELLCLLRWLTEHDITKLKKIIGKALSSGLSKQIQQAENNTEPFELEEAQQSITDFFLILENIMTEVIHEQTFKKAVEKKLIPSVEHIDSTICDNATVRFSIEKASSKSTHCTQESTEELFFKEILKRWKPTKKNTLN